MKSRAQEIFEALENYKIDLTLELFVNAQTTDNPISFNQIEQYVKCKNKEEQFDPLKDQTGVLALRMAIQKNQIEVVEYLINDLGVSILQQDLHGNNALHWAATTNIETFKKVASLLEDKKDAVMEMENFDGLTPLMIGAGFGEKDICQYIYQEFDADPGFISSKDKNALWEAAKYGSLNVLNWLKEEKFDPTKNAIGTTSLMRAIENNQMAVIRFLVNEWNIPIFSTENFSALHHAATVDLSSQNEKGRLEVIDFLLKKGARLYFNNQSISALCKNTLISVRLKIVEAKLLQDRNIGSIGSLQKIIEKKKNNLKENIEDIIKEYQSKLHGKRKLNFTRETRKSKPQTEKDVKAIFDKVLNEKKPVSIEIKEEQEIEKPLKIFRKPEPLDGAYQNWENEFSRNNYLTCSKESGYRVKLQAQDSENNKIPFLIEKLKKTLTDRHIDWELDDSDIILKDYRKIKPRALVNFIERDYNEVKCSKQKTKAITVLATDRTQPSNVQTIPVLGMELGDSLLGDFSIPGESCLAVPENKVTTLAIMNQYERSKPAPKKEVKSQSAEIKTKRQPAELNKKVSISIAFKGSPAFLLAQPKNVSELAKFDAKSNTLETKPEHKFDRSELIKAAFENLAKMISMQEIMLDDPRCNNVDEAIEWRATRHFGTLYFLTRSFVMLRLAKLNETQQDVTGMRNLLMHGSHHLIEEEAVVKKSVDDLKGKKLPKSMLRLVPVKKRQALAKHFAQDQEEHMLIEENSAYKFLAPIFDAQETTDIPDAENKVKKLLLYVNAIMAQIKKAGKKQNQHNWLQGAIENASSLADTYFPSFEAAALLLIACGELARHASELNTNNSTDQFFSLCLKIRSDLGHRSNVELNYKDILMAYHHGQRINTNSDLKQTCFAGKSTTETKEQKSPIAKSKASLILFNNDRETKYLGEKKSPEELLDKNGNLKLHEGYTGIKKIRRYSI